METISRHIEDVLAFREVAVAKSFTSAALNSGRSKSHLSKQILRLEAALGVKLLQRTTRRLDLTSEGASLLLYSEKIFCLAEAAGRQLRKESTGEEGLIRISAPLSLAEVLFPQIQAELESALPKVTFDFDSTNTKRPLSKEGVDFAFRAADDQDPERVSQFQGVIRDVICVSPDLLATLPPLETPRDLRQIPALLHSGSERFNRWTFRRDDDEVVVQPRSRLYSSSYSLLRTWCKEGKGIARLPLYSVEGELKSRTLVCLLEDFTIATHPLYFIRARGEFQTARHREAKKILLNWLSRSKRFFLK